MKNFNYCMAQLRIIWSIFLVFGGVSYAQAQDPSINVCATGDYFITKNHLCTALSDASYLSASPDTVSAPSGSASILIANVLANDTVFWSIDDTADPDNVEVATINDFQLAVVTPASDAGVMLNTLTGAVKAKATVPPGLYFIQYKVCFFGGFRINNSTGESTPYGISEKCSLPTTVTITVTDQVAGTCDMSLSYMPAVNVPPGSTTAVPSLGIFAVGALGALLAGLAWRSRHQGDKYRLLAIAGIAASVSLFSLGGGSWIESVRAAGPYEFISPAGGTVADNRVVYSDPALLLIVTNTSGVRMRITANLNPAETGTCLVNHEIAPGASCTTQASSCTAPVQPLLISNISAPAIGCTNDPELGGYFNNLNDANAGYFSAYAPLLVAGPAFNDPWVTTSFSYTRNATDAVYDGSNNLTNGDALKSGVVTVTSTAPEGYVFSPDNTSTMTWTLPYMCWSEPA